MLRGIPVPVKAALFSAAFSFLAAGCATPDAFGGSRSAVVGWALERGFDPGDMAVGGFRLLSLSRHNGATDTLTVYIEDDGATWTTPYHPPRDPTPVKPIALALAAQDPAPAVVYLGRPCQYLDEASLSQCDSAYWLGSRFAPEVVSAYEAALDRLKAKHAVRYLHLVGHSGGGVVATLIAQRRSDVVALVTVASPLALADWTNLHRVTPLSASLDPLRQELNLPYGVHWAGGRDKNVPPTIVARFVQKSGGRLMTVPDFDHECCWAQEWPALLHRSLRQETFHD